MSSAPLVTAPIREARGRLRQSLAAIADRVGGLAGLPIAERSAAMARVAADLDERLRPHLEWEERTIHPVVDKFACEGPAAFSASMRYEHQIIYRSIGELRGLALDAATVVAFSRRADNLLGVVLAHFELEEEVLFPILDRALDSTCRLSVVAPPSH
jgi:hypothetical protein